MSGFVTLGRDKQAGASSGSPSTLRFIIMIQEDAPQDEWFQQKVGIGQVGENIRLHLNSLVQVSGPSNSVVKRERT